MTYFGISQWREGLLLAVYTEKGLRAIFLGENPDDLTQKLRQKFPHAQSATQAHNMDHKLKELVAYVNAPHSVYQGSLDFQGTDFQKSVWKVLKHIPIGQTMSYSTVAQKVNRPTAYRAVAQACGANPWPLVIPCHRVVGKIGLGGYLYGLPLKEKLLKEEALQAQKQRK